MLGAGSLRARCQDRQEPDRHGRPAKVVLDSQFRLIENKFMQAKMAAHALDLFEAFAALRRPASLSELAQQLGMPVSSCFGLVRTIEARGYLYSLKPRGPLYPTRRLLRIMGVIAAHDPLTARVSETLQALRDACGETVVIGKLRDREVLYVDVFESPHAIRYMPHPGDTRALHANSLGKALLGTLSPAILEKMLPSLSYRPFTDRTLTSHQALAADIAISRDRGWYGNFRESVEDLCAVARPLLINGQPFAVSIAGPDHRMQPAALDSHLAALARACEVIADP
jgi:DNA-binding IclR family transcriptional regulator